MMSPFQPARPQTRALGPLTGNTAPVESTGRTPVRVVQVPPLPHSATEAKPAPFSVPPLLRLSWEGGAGGTLQLGGLRSETWL